MSLKNLLQAAATRIANADINPILLKEMRQLVRSRIICTGLVLYSMLLFAVASVALLVQTDPSDNPASLMLGETISKAIFYPLFYVVVAAVPLYIGVRFTLERNPKRIDLQYTTDLTPRQIIDGKHSSAMMLSVMLASVAVPFMVMSYLLRGMDLRATLLSVAAMVVVSFVANYLAVAVAAQPLSKAMRILLLLQFAWAAMPLSVAAAELPREIEWENTLDKWAIVVILTGIVVIGVMLARSHAIAVLSPRSSNRDRRFRLTLIFANILWLGLMIFGSVVDSFRRSGWHRPGHSFNYEFLLYGWSLPMICVGIGLLLTHCGSTLAATRRTLAERSRNRVRRFLQYPLFTGAPNGIAFSVIFLLAMAAVHCALLFLAASPSGRGRIVDFLFDEYLVGVAAPLFLVAVLDFIAVALIIRAAWRTFLQRRVSAKYIPLAVAVAFGLANAIPPILSIGEPDIRMLPIPLYILSFFRFSEAGAVGDSQLGFFIVAHCAYALILTAAAVAANARVFRRSWKEHMERPVAAPSAE